MLKNSHLFDVETFYLKQRNESDIPEWVAMKIKTEKEELGRLLLRINDLRTNLVEWALGG